MRNGERNGRKEKKGKRRKEKASPETKECFPVDKVAL